MTSLARKTIFFLSLFLVFPLQVLAQTAPISPTLNGIIYDPPYVGTTTTKLTNQQIAQKMHLVIYSRNQATTNIANYRNAGFIGPAVQYVIMNPGMFGPSDISTTPPSGSSSYCSNTDNSWKPSASNNITFQIPGIFCLIQNSIIAKQKNPPDESKKFDHDLNPATPNIWADESWFLHRSDNGQRYSHSSLGGYAYDMNHGNVAWQQFFAAYSIAQLTGKSATTSDPRTWTASGLDGVFLDNLDLTWDRLTSQNSSPKEYSSTSAYVQSEISFVSYLHSALHSNGHNYPLYANLTHDTASNSTQWDPFTTILDGGMSEGFVLNWGRCATYPATSILAQLTQAEKWLQAGNSFVAIGQGNLTCGSTTFDSEANFSLAAYLMVTNGTHAYYKYADYTKYKEFYDYPQYYYQLGMPKGPKQLTSTNVYTRYFDCGSVVLNLSTSPYTSQISLTPNCTTSITPKYVIQNLYGANLTADLNKDGKVNSLDFALSIH